VLKGLKLNLKLITSVCCFVCGPALLEAAATASLNSQACPQNGDCHFLRSVAYGDGAVQSEYVAACRPRCVRVRARGFTATLESCGVFKAICAHQTTQVRYRVNKTTTIPCCISLFAVCLASLWQLCIAGFWWESREEKNALEDVHDGWIILNNLVFEHPVAFHHIRDKTTAATRRDHRETRNLQHTDQTSGRRPSVGKILKILRKLSSKEFIYRILVS
jgi:hypothetical protein